MEPVSPLSRRRLLRSLAATGAAAMLWPSVAPAQQGGILTKPIPLERRSLPVVGLGTWITFNVGDESSRAMNARKSCAPSSTPAGA